VFSDTLNFEFKWSDNSITDGNIMDFYVNGDAAPGGRFNFVYNTTVVTSVGKKSEVPKRFSLKQNYPNPFNPTTTIKYSIPINVKSEMSNVKIIVYDILGREVTTLVSKQQSAGNYEVVFDATKLPSGTYFYKLQSGDFRETKKLLLLR